MIDLPDEQDTGSTAYPVSQGLATRNAYAKALFMLVFQALNRFLGSPNLACRSMTEWFGRRDGLQEGN